MPSLWREGGYRFHFYAAEGDPSEPPHVHVQKGPEGAKFWLTPTGPPCGQRPDDRR